MFIMSMARSRDISLNMFLMSSEIKHRVGGLVFKSVSDLVMYLSTSADMVW